MQRIEFDGKVHEFPEDFTDDDIAAALQPPPPEPVGPFVEVGSVPTVQLRLDGVDDLKFEPKPEGWRPDALPEDLSHVKELARDTETTGLRWWDGDRVVGVSYAWFEDEKVRSIYLPTGHRGGGNLDPDLVARWEREQIKGKHLDGLNTKFDIHSSRESGLDLVALGCTFGDVGLNAALLDDHRRFFSLESIAQDVLGVGKVEGFDRARIADYPAWMVAEYARRDAELVLRIKKLQLPVIRLQALDRVYALECACIPATVEMERNGAPMDLEKLERWVRDSERRLNALHLEIAREAGHPVNPDRRDDMIRLFRERGLESDEVTESGAPSFSDAVLARAARRDPVIALVRRAAHLADLRAKFLVPYWRDSQSDGILRYSLNQLRCDREEGGQQGTVSGRYSSSQPVKGFGANIQQVLAVSKQLRLHCHACEANWDGRDVERMTRRHRTEHPEAFLVRELFVPRSGILAAADAKQIELRVFAHLSGSDRLAKIYADDPDTDFHQVVGDMVAAYRPDFERKRVKNISFARLFGAGIKKLAAMMGVDEGDARAMGRVYDKAFPEVSQTLKRAMEVAEERGYVRTVLGRRIRFVQGCRCGACITFGPRYHKALNGAVQGGAADINKLKIVELYEAREELGLTLRMTVHDEAVGDVPDQAAAARMDAILQRQAVDLRVPILWDTATGINWAECA
jgi:DNA polymerase-1